ncbi:hypothetical protein PV10_02381 [Exophiala mesophila]|uniref:Zn(2)-C6 fungal-type domain-containing protein n=2 Tax=Exophiala mesophila TaxID=212818 RepID=A0A0D1Y257_EXOME|nr:uncharacterized protein PV10_02381 [Exophiala mesophila]KIV94631.1 hypothetical protein PV10_02381 [Exophiala mesophila]
MSQASDSPVSDPPTGGSSGISTPPRRACHACDSCHRRKIKCDGSTPPCDWCRHHNVTCTFNRVKGGRRKRQAGSIKLRKKNIIQRIGRIEQILIENFRRREDETSQISIGAGTGTSVTNTTSSDPSVDSLGRIFLTSYKLGDINVFHGVPYITPKGQKWIGFRHEDNAFNWPQIPLWQNQQTLFKPGCLPRPSMQDLPARHLVDALFAYYQSSGFAVQLPLVDPVLFALTIDEAYSSDITDERRAALLKAYIFAFLATGPLMGNQRPNLIPDTDARVYEVAEQLTPYIYAARASTEIVDALVMLVIYHFSCGSIHAADISLSLASRLLFTMGAHLYPGKTMDESPEEQRDLETRAVLHRRDLFWMCFTLDMEITFRTGRPPIMAYTSCDLTFPAYYLKQISPGFTGVAKLPGDLRLSIIKSKAYEKLYSPHSLNNSDAEILRDIRELDDMLENWRLSLPLESRPTLSFSEDTKITRSPHITAADINPILTRLEYHHCMTTIHQAGSRCKTWADNRMIDQGLTTSMELALESSRSLLSYLNSMEPIFLPNLFWIILFYPISAALVLFSNILLNPLSASAACDLKQLGECLEIVTKKVQFNSGLSDSNLSHMKHVRCAAEEIYRMGQKAVAQAKQAEVQGSSAASEALDSEMEYMQIQ